jgi:DNA-binding transcriptional ArsR family regulator
MTTGARPDGARRRSTRAGDQQTPQNAWPAGEASARWKAHPLAAASGVIRECLGPIATATAQFVVVSDADGMVLWMDGPDGVRLDGAESMHFNGGVQERTRAAAPVHDPDTGLLLGIIDVIGKLGTVDPFSLGCAVATARAVEYHLLSVMYERDARLRARYEDRIVAGGPRAALLTPSGRVISAGDSVSWIGATRVAVPPGGGELTVPSGVRAFAEPVGQQEAFVVRAADRSRADSGRPRLRLRLLRRDQPGVELDGRLLALSPTRIEILALLCARPGGMTSEELAADLYGDDGRPSAVRVQIFRLRKDLGPWIDTAPYRLALDVDSDVAEVCRLLDSGAVREAAERYQGPLLADSEAPGVVRERDALETWLRQAVMTSDEPEALWAWTQSWSGREDLAAWKRLLANLDYSDRRRTLAASRVSALRTDGVKTLARAA